MTDEELAAICERADAATPGPWNVFDYVIWGRAGSSGPYQLSIAKNANSSSVIEDTGAADRRDRRIEADLGFIAHAREDIPALLAENAALREIVEAVASRAWPWRTDGRGHVMCAYCWARDHAPDCIWVKAHAILAKEEQEQ
jgi:hypothetical protein